MTDMTKSDLLNLLKSEAMKYRKDCNASLRRNSHMHLFDGELSQDAIDAVLTDFINRVGYDQGVDYALYAGDMIDTAIHE